MATKSESLKTFATTVKIPIDEIVINDWNPNFLSTAMQAAIQDDISKNGFIGQIVVQKHNERLQKDNVIINGEHRYQAAKALGYKSLPCVVLDCNDSKAKTLTVRLNREHGDLMPDKLSELLRNIQQQEDASMEQLRSITAISESELDLLLNLEKNSEAMAGDPAMILNQGQDAKRKISEGQDLTLGWHVIEEFTKQAAYQLSKKPVTESTIIVAIANGGLIPAKLLSEFLQIERIAMMPKGPSLNVNKDTEFVSLASMTLTSDRIIIVDDIYDTGKTHKWAIDNIKRISGENSEIDYCVIVAKSKPPIAKKIISGSITNTKQWVVFPWEELRF